MALSVWRFGVVLLSSQERSYQDAGYPHGQACAPHSPDRRGAGAAPEGLAAPPIPTASDYPANGDKRVGSLPEALEACGIVEGRTVGAPAARPCHAPGWILRTPQEEPFLEVDRGEEGFSHLQQ
jgi:hypothetical protein